MENYDLDYRSINPRKPERFAQLAAAIRSNAGEYGGLPVNGLAISAQQVRAADLLYQKVNSPDNKGALAELLKALGDEPLEPKEYDLLDPYARKNVNEPSARSQAFGKYLREVDGIAISDAQIEAVFLVGRVEQGKRNLAAA